jgi:hypothetical protein
MRRKAGVAIGLAHGPSRPAPSQGADKHRACAVVGVQLIEGVHPPGLAGTAIPKRVSSPRRRAAAEANVPDMHGWADDMDLLGHEGADGDGLTHRSHVGHDGYTVSVRMSLAESGAKRFGEADVPVLGYMPMVFARKRTFSGASDPYPIPATPDVVDSWSRSRRA